MQTAEVGFDFGSFDEARLRLNRIAGRCPGVKAAFDRIDFAEAVFHEELRRTGA